MLTSNRIYLFTIHDSQLTIHNSQFTINYVKWNQGSFTNLINRNYLAGKSESVFLKGFNFMPIWLKATGKWGSILVLVALVITLVKQLIALVGIVMFAIKILIVLVFVALFLGVGILIFRAWSESQKRKGNA